jgi:hypothetical protein
MLSPTQRINSLISSNTIDPKYFYILGSPSYYLDKDKKIISKERYSRLPKEDKESCKPQY